MNGSLYNFCKRTIDVLLSLIGIIVCSFLLWVWILLINAFVTKGHPVFVQKRLGKNKKVFGLLKFRSMKISANPNLAPSHMSEDTQHSMETKFGSFLRKTSLDETLQLFNIFIGQMSFVGPRPGAAVNEDDLILARENHTPSAFDVRPGLTGLAQVTLKREHDPEEKAKLDSEYVKTMSFWLDIKIFFKTLLVVIVH